MLVLIISHSNPLLLLTAGVTMDSHGVLFEPDSVSASEAGCGHAALPVACK